MRRKPSVEHLEDVVILAYLDGELSRLAARKAQHHLQSCWNCRSAAAELELLAQTAYALLSSGDEADTVHTGTAKVEFLRRKAKIDEAWDKKSRRCTSMLFQRPSPRLDETVYGPSVHLYRSEPMGASVRPQLFQRPPGMKLSPLKEGCTLFVV